MAFNLYTTQKVKSSEKLEKSVWPILQNYKNVSVSQNLSISWRFNLFESFYTEILSLDRATFY